MLLNPELQFQGLDGLQILLMILKGMSTCSFGFTSGVVGAAGDASGCCGCPNACSGSKVFPEERLHHLHMAIKQITYSLPCKFTSFCQYSICRVSSLGSLRKPCTTASSDSITYYCTSHDSEVYFQKQSTTSLYYY
jgi:hypothetical protein